MPDDKAKKKKKPKHTALVAPGGSKKKKAAASGRDRLGRSLEGEGAEPRGQAAQAGRSPAGSSTSAAVPGAQAAAPTNAGQGTDTAQPPGGAPLRQPAGGVSRQAVPGGPSSQGPGEPESNLPPNAIVMPRRRKSRLTPKKRKRRRRGIRALVVLAVAAVLVVFYVSGAYVTTATLARDAWDGLRIAASPGDGWPMNLAVTGFITAKPLGNGNGFAALGERDAVMVDASGKELWRVQHSYMSPGISAGNTRMVVYGRGGTEYTVEGRSSTLATRTTEHEIQFCELSAEGWLAVFTASRYRATLDVYGPAYDAGDVEFHMPLVDARPVLARFAGDNKNLLVGCVATRSGALGSTIYLLNTGRNEIQAEVRANAAQLLDAAWVDGSHFVAVYDQYAALYDNKGEEQARYDYGQRTLQAADIRDGNVALAFGSSAQETFHTLMLDGGLEPMFDASVTGTGTVRVLAASNGAWLMCGQEVYAYTAEGVLSGSRRLEPRTLTLVYGGEALVLATGQADSVDALLNPAAESESESAAFAGSGVAPEAQSGGPEARASGAE